MHWLSFLIGALVGWLIGWLIDFLLCRPRRAATEADLRGKLDRWRGETAQRQVEIERLNAELAAARFKAGSLDAAMGVAAMDAAYSDATRTSAVDIPLAPAQKPDDLTVVEGIGAKVSELLAQNDIYTYAQLAATSVERLRAILDSGGSRFRIAIPETWPEQALLARDGKWDELQALQDSLHGGRRG